jgi:hypothetical protein
VPGRTELSACAADSAAENGAAGAYNDTAHGGSSNAPKGALTASNLARSPGAWLRISCITAILHKDMLTSLKGCAGVSVQAALLQAGAATWRTRTAPCARCAPAPRSASTTASPSPSAAVRPPKSNPPPGPHAADLLHHQSESAQQPEIVAHACCDLGYQSRLP